MKYNPLIDRFTITDANLKTAAKDLLYVIKNARLIAGVTLDKRPRRGVPMTRLDHLEANVLQAAAEFGISFGVQSGNDLDLREVE